MRLKLSGVVVMKQHVRVRGSEVVDPKGYWTTTSEVGQAGAFGNGMLTGLLLLRRPIAHALVGLNYS